MALNEGQLVKQHSLPLTMKSYSKVMPGCSIGTAEKLLSVREQRSIQRNEAHKFCFPLTLSCPAKVKVSENGVKWHRSIVPTSKAYIEEFSRKKCAYGPPLHFLPQETARSNLTFLPVTVFSSGQPILVLQHVHTTLPSVLQGSHLNTVSEWMIWLSWGLNPGPPTLNGGHRNHNAIDTVLLGVDRCVR